MSRLGIVICCVTLIACDRKSPPSPPVVEPPGANETVNGTERLGWDQRAADTAELATIGYAVYVDGARQDLAGAACASTAGAAGFACTARLPQMSPGSHILELASFINDGGVLESARSAALHVTAVAQTASPAAASAPVLRSGVAARSSVIADGLESPIDVAFAPDGRIFVAERAGRIRIVRDGRLAEEPALTLGEVRDSPGPLLAIALDPQFSRTHYVFAIYTAPDRSRGMTFVLARFREVSDTLGDHVVLLEGGRASSSSPSATLRIGADGMLYAAFDDGGEQRLRGDAASLNGKLVRVNSDGTTPSDARGGNPAIAAGYGSPLAMDWDPVTSTLWIADRSAGGAPFTFYAGARFPLWTGRMLTAATLFDAATAATVSFVAAAPDGAVYYGTGRSIGRLAPDRGP